MVIFCQIDICIFCVKLNIITNNLFYRAGLGMLFYFRINLLFIMLMSLNIQSMQFIQKYIDKFKQVWQEQLRLQQEAEKWVGKNLEVTDYTRHVVGRVMANGPVITQPTLQELYFLFLPEKIFKNYCYYAAFPKDMMAISAKFAEDAMQCKDIEDQFYAVLSHENGHKQLKHVYYRLMSLPIAITLSYFCASYLKNKISNKINKKIKSLLGSIITIQIAKFFLGFLSRHQEFEADKFAAKSFDGKYTNALIKYFESADEFEKDNLPQVFGSKWFRILMGISHPTCQERIGALRKIQEDIC